MNELSEKTLINILLTALEKFYSNDKYLVELKEQGH
jgi:hypothetical protein